MYKQIAANKRNTVLIMLFFVLIIAAVGWFIAYFMHDWMIAAWILVIAIVYAVIQYFISAQLAVMMTGLEHQ